jgi:serine/threonine protein kinase
MSEAPPAVEGGPPPLAAHPPDALAEGTRLAEFEIRRVLGAGGFGIVYLAWDHQLERDVALKEYMPITLAGRGADHRVSIRAQAHQDTFALGLRSFVNEARLLARFDHPSLVKVYRFWEDNGTAYMAMPMYHGRTLRQVRQQMGGASPGEAWCRSLLDPLLGAIDCLHREGVYHRDIAPDNIVLTEAGKPVLLDFGAARRVIGDRTHALTAILKPNFAPIEQYADVASLRQGPWTDLYGLAASFYYLLAGQPPLPAAARALNDDLPPLALLQPADCSEGFLQALDWAMAVRPQQRPQSVALWRDVLEGRIGVPALARHDAARPGVATLPVAPAPDFDPTQPMPPSPPGSMPASSPLWRGFTVPGGVRTLQAAPAAGAARTGQARDARVADAPVVDGSPPATEAAGGAAAAPVPWPRRRPWLAGVLVAGGLLGLAGAFAWRPPAVPLPGVAASSPAVVMPALPPRGPASGPAAVPEPATAVAAAPPLQGHRGVGARGRRGHRRRAAGGRDGVLARAGRVVVAVAFAHGSRAPTA